MNKKNIILLLFACSVSFLAGFLIDRGEEKIVKTDSDVEEELAWHISQLEALYPPLEEEIYLVGGEVIEIGSDYLIIEREVRTRQVPSIEEGLFETWNIRINITEETEIFKSSVITDLGQGAVIDDPFQREIVSIEDIKEGSLVGVKSDKNIKGEKEVLAAQIEVYDF